MSKYEFIKAMMENRKMKFDDAEKVYAYILWKRKQRKEKEKRLTKDKNYVIIIIERSKING